MHFVERALARPNRCQALPQLGQDHPKGYVDFGAAGGHPQDPEVYLSVEALQMCALKVPQAGLALADDLAAAQAQLEQSFAEIDDLRAQIQKLEQEQNAIDVLAHKDGHYAKHKRTGRPPKETANAKAGS